MSNNTFLCMAMTVCAGVLGGAALVSVLLPNHADNTAAIIDAWSPVVPLVYCNFENGTVEQVGAGILHKRPDGALDVLTSQDVLGDGSTKPEVCGVDFPNGTSVTVSGAGIAPDPQSIAVGTLHLTTLDRRTATLPRADQQTCGSARIGDKVIVLAYPFAVAGGLIATEGIIAGTDLNKDYLTSAMTNAQSTGGVVIDVPGDCYLGMISNLGIVTSSVTPPGEARLGEIWKWQEFSADIQGQL
jgi:hypothetical protein